MFFKITFVSLSGLNTKTNQIDCCQLNWYVMNEKQNGNNCKVFWPRIIMEYVIQWAELLMVIEFNIPPKGFSFNLV